MPDRGADLTGVSASDTAISNLGPTNSSLVRDVDTSSNYGDGLRMTNTSGTSTQTSNPLQWTLNHAGAGSNNGYGFNVVATAQSMAGGGMSFQPWIDCYTFANSSGGCRFTGATNTSLYGLALQGCFLGGDGNSEVDFETAGGGESRIINCFFEHAGRNATGRGGATPASGNGFGVSIGADNDGVQIVGASIVQCSWDGINDGHQGDGPTVVTGCRIFNNGLANVSGAQCGIHASQGNIVVSGSFIGNWGGNTTQSFGVYTDVDSVVVSGNNLKNNRLGAVSGTLGAGSQVGLNIT
jgi:hypothetical protein